MEHALEDGDVGEVDRLIAEWPDVVEFRGAKVAALVATDRQFDPETGQPTDEYRDAVARLTAMERDRWWPPSPAPSDSQLNERIWSTMIGKIYPGLVGHPPGTPAGKRLAETYCRLLAKVDPMGVNVYSGYDENRPAGRQVCVDYRVS